MLFIASSHRPPCPTFRAVQVVTAASWHVVSSEPVAQTSSQVFVLLSEVEPGRLALRDVGALHLMLATADAHPAIVEVGACYGFGLGQCVLAQVARQTVYCRRSRLSALLCSCSDPLDCFFCGVPFQVQEAFVNLAANLAADPVTSGQVLASGAVPRVLRAMDDCPSSSAVQVCV